MENKQGFSLIEIIVALVIVALATTLILPNLMVSVEQTKAQAAKNNLLAIAAAQEKYYEDHSSYSKTSGATLLSALSMTIQIGDPFTYDCTIAVSPYGCTASDATGVTLTLSVTSTGASVACTAGGKYCPS